MANNNGYRRRDILKSSGVAVAITGLFAGCSGQQGESDDSSTDNSSSDKTSTPTQQSNTEPIKIGAPQPYSGDFGWIGQNTYSAARVPISKVNDAGGIDGRQVKLIQEDTPLGVDPTVSAVRKLISSNNVDAIFGTNSAGIMSIVDIAQDAEICVISPVAGTRELANVGGKYIFRSSPGDELGGRVVSLAVSSPDYDKDYERMALVLATRSNDLSYKQPIRDSFEGIITTIKEVSPDATSYTSAMDDVISSDPEMIFFAMPPGNGIRLIKAGFQQGYEGNWFGADSMSNESFLEKTEDELTAGMLASRATFSQKAQETGRLNQFDEELQEITDTQRDQFSISSYDGINVLLLAIKKASVDGEITRNAIANNMRPVSNPPGTAVTGVMDGIEALDAGEKINYQGIGGPMNLDKKGNVRAPFEVLQAQGDKYNQIGIVQPEDLA